MTVVGLAALALFGVAAPSTAQERRLSAAEVRRQAIGRPIPDRDLPSRTFELQAGGRFAWTLVSRGGRDRHGRPYPAAEPITSTGRYTIRPNGDVCLQADDDPVPSCVRVTRSNGELRIVVSDEPQPGDICVASCHSHFVTSAGFAVGSDAEMERLNSQEYNTCRTACEQGRFRRQRSTIEILGEGGRPVLAVPVRRPSPWAGQAAEAMLASTAPKGRSP